MEPSGVKRRLTCILAADAVGYSGQMGQDEEGTVRVLSAHRAVIDGIIAFHNGRILSTAGDSVLAEFSSVVEAVRCAVEIQDALRTRNDALPEHRRMLFRIGVNLGDVIVKNEDLLGDGVNVAARLEGIAEPGGICISSSVYDQITGKLDLGFLDLGEQSLKNITRPIRVFRVSGAGALARPAPPAASAPPQRKSFPTALVAAGALVIVAVVASIFQLFPSGDRQGKLITDHQPVTLAAMEGLFNTESGASIVLIGQPNTTEQKLDNPVYVPKALSFLTHRRWEAEVKGLNDFPRDQWPDNIPLLYYSYHIMVGLGTFFILITIVAVLLLWRKKLFSSKWMLWILMLSFPFPFIANTAGWITAEVGRQPWLVYGLMRTSQGFSTTVSAGNGLFTLIGFMGMYMVLGIMFLFLVFREVAHGPKFLSSGGANGGSEIAPAEVGA